MEIQKKIKILKSIEELQHFRKSVNGLKIGFVPTMGALHAGHASLMTAARSENDICILSIFVNPTQFNDPKDFEKYPQTWPEDLKLAETCGMDAIFVPTFDLMYPDHYKYKVSENDLSLHFCGAHRPGHFDGVLSIVMKLFLLVKPTNAYFGEKDFQQLTLIQGMVKAFFMDLQIIPIPTLREIDGLAMSSRNVRLTPEERLKAPQFYQVLTSAKSAAIATEQLTQMGFKVDYVEDWQNRRLAAVFLGSVRLIDNVNIKL